MRRSVAFATLAAPLRQREAVDTETPASCATAWSVGVVRGVGTTGFMAASVLGKPRRVKGTAGPVGGKSRAAVVESRRETPKAKRQTKRNFPGSNLPFETCLEVGVWTFRRCCAAALRANLRNVCRATQSHCPHDSAKSALVRPRCRRCTPRKDYPAASSCAPVHPHE